METIERLNRVRTKTKRGFGDDILIHCTYTFRLNEVPGDTGLLYLHYGAGRIDYSIVMERLRRTLVEGSFPLESTDPVIRFSDQGHWMDGVIEVGYVVWRAEEEVEQVLSIPFER